MSTADIFYLHQDDKDWELYVQSLEGKVVNFLILAVFVMGLPWMIHDETYLNLRENVLRARNRVQVRRKAMRR